MHDFYHVKPELAHCFILTHCLEGCSVLGAAAGAILQVSFCCSFVYYIGSFDSYVQWYIRRGCLCSGVSPLALPVGNYTFDVFRIFQKVHSQLGHFWHLGKSLAVWLSSWFQHLLIVVLIGSNVVVFLPDCTPYPFNFWELSVWLTVSAVLCCVSLLPGCCDQLKSCVM